LRRREADLAHLLDGSSTRDHLQAKSAMALRPIGNPSINLPPRAVSFPPGDRRTPAVQIPDDIIAQLTTEGGGNVHDHPIVIATASFCETRRQCPTWGHRHGSSWSVRVRMSTLRASRTTGYVASLGGDASCPVNTQSGCQRQSERCGPHRDRGQWRDRDRSTGSRDEGTAHDSAGGRGEKGAVTVGKAREYRKESREDGPPRLRCSAAELNECRGSKSLSETAGAHLSGLRKCLTPPSTDAHLTDQSFEVKPVLDSHGPKPQRIAMVTRIQFFRSTCPVACALSRDASAKLQSNYRRTN
jgi:hypothetical protein